MNLGKRVKKLRKSLGLTQKEFARRVAGKIDHTYIGKIERGHQYPSIKLLEKIGRAYHIPLSYFFQGENERAKILRWLDLIKKLQEELKKLKEEVRKGEEKNC